MRNRLVVRIETSLSHEIESRRAKSVNYASKETTYCRTSRAGHDCRMSVRKAGGCTLGVL